MMQLEQMTARKQKSSSLFCFHLLPWGTGYKAGRDQTHMVTNKLGINFGIGTQGCLHWGNGSRDYQDQAGKLWSKVCGDVAHGAKWGDTFVRGLGTTADAEWGCAIFTFFKINQNSSDVILKLPRFLSANKELRIFFFKTPCRPREHPPAEWAQPKANTLEILF